ncbi:hypothetical protein B4U80_06300 [Leptotrombidium deliense]|uniref:Uncharacterized protein n=1 Tax=Leptotrombidium deliense TaxID=299467 RepID=A0A443S4B1_9ACAR|nr:hypothetical protein B4U80_06300 [Leptotrombidium deliense]
MLPMSTTLEQF